MFNFTTQTLVRDDKNIVVKGLGNGGALDNISHAIINGVELPKNKNVKYISVFKQAPIAGTNASVNLDLSNVDFGDSGFGRIAIQIKLSNSSVDPLFANNMVYRGKPIYAEFKIAKKEVTNNNNEVTATNYKPNAGEVQSIAKTLNKVSTFDSQILKATADGTTLRITCAENYMNLDSVKVQKFVETTGSCDNCCHYDEQFEDLIETQAKGVEEFGTYKWILHNLRIPTDASQAYNGQLSTMGELPAPGEKYTQYTIKMEADRENIGGMVVGEKTTSVTTHVFYVKTGSPLEQTFKYNNLPMPNLEAAIDIIIGVITGKLTGFTSININGSVLNINGDLADVQGLSVLGNDTNLQED